LRNARRGKTKKLSKTIEKKRSSKCSLDSIQLFKLTKNAFLFPTILISPSESLLALWNFSHEKKNQKVMTCVGFERARVREREMG
jgi:hypothetical protein